jgi:DNA-binding transcriptional MerR regulator
MMTMPSPALRLGLSQVETAALLAVTDRTLRNWQRSGFGPRPIRDGARLLYDRAEVEAFAVGAGQ